MPLSLLWVV